MSFIFLLIKKKNAIFLHSQTRFTTKPLKICQKLNDELCWPDDDGELKKKNKIDGMFVLNSVMECKKGLKKSDNNLWLIFYDWKR